MTWRILSKIFSVAYKVLLYKRRFACIDERTRRIVLSLPRGTFWKCCCGIPPPIGTLKLKCYRFFKARLFKLKNVLFLGLMRKKFTYLFGFWSHVRSCNLRELWELMEYTFPHPYWQFILLPWWLFLTWRLLPLADMNLRVQPGSKHSNILISVGGSGGVNTLPTAAINSPITHLGFILT